MFGARLATAEVLFLASVHLAYWLAWAGSLALSIVLVVLMWTRWGQSRPLHKCAALSLLVHLILAFLTMTVRIVSGDGGGGGGEGEPIRVHIVQDAGAVATAASIVAEKVIDVAPPLLESPKKEKSPTQIADTPSPPAKPKEPRPVAEQPAHDPVQNIAVAHASEQPAPSPEELATGTAKNEPKVSQPPKSIVENRTRVSQPTAVAQKPPAAKTAQSSAAVSDSSISTTTSPYALRSASDRLSLIEGQGGSAQTEAAVTAALAWLATAQSRDGRWNANQFGAGHEQLVLGQDRGGAGRNADTGISALALLAFLGAGHSHSEGEYRETVQRGLDFLLRSQAADGSMFGDATFYAQMYCHSMATFALAEAQALTGDRRLEPAVTKAVNFSLDAQNASTGGWRYRAGDSGDTSQLGWQIMSLASAKRAGINLPDQTWNRVDRFLRSVRRGNYGGLASYRPDSPASTSMTAEALYCHLVLEEAGGMNLPEPAATEATNQLLATVPSADRVNLYYWYYATLALHHRQQSSKAAAAAWHTWNDAVTAALLNTQVAHGSDAGSWPPNTVWGSYGGRVYTTAMSAMCLEVYYRYATAPEVRDNWTAARSESHPAAR